MWIKICGMTTPAAVSAALEAGIDAVGFVFAPSSRRLTPYAAAALAQPVRGRLPVVRSTVAVPMVLPSRILFEGPGSGTGAVSDWALAASLARRTQLVLAGGLSAANIAAALARVRPWGVDVSSGVESQPGVKNPAEIVKFVTAVRAATSMPAAMPGEA
jgi:phosphoribosylanthranilate isomerase